MATARLTVGTLLDTVSTAAETVTQSLNAASNGVGMLNAFVNKAALEQRLRHKAEESVFKAHLIDEKAQEETMLMLRTEDFLAKSERHAHHYAAAFKKYETILG